MAKLNWTAEAERWLNDIFSYIAADNFGAAKEVVEGVYRRAQLLQDFPEAGYRYEGSSENIRILLYGHYRIAYLQRSDDDIDILGDFMGHLILIDIWFEAQYNQSNQSAPFCRRTLLTLHPCCVRYVS